MPWCVTIGEWIREGKTMVDEAVMGCVSLQKWNVLRRKYIVAGNAAVASVVEDYGTCLKPCQSTSGG
jgi:hypothetical protein